MEENELFGEAHEQEENGLFGKRHQAEQLNLYGVGSSFYCQRDIEGQSICDSQCDHCEEYYRPLEQ